MDIPVYEGNKGLIHAHDTVEIIYCFFHDINPGNKCVIRSGIMMYPCFQPYYRHSKTDPFRSYLITLLDVQGKWIFPE